jgi:DNA-directed RNA polymerase specialized sigma subunit
MACERAAFMYSISIGKTRDSRSGKKILKAMEKISKEKGRAHWIEAIEIAKASGIKLDKVRNCLEQLNSNKDVCSRPVLVGDYPYERIDHNCYKLPKDEFIEEYQSHAIPYGV